MVNADENDVFHGELLRKKMKKNTWRQYWVVLRKDKLVFMCENEGKVAGIVKLSEETTCKVLRRKTSKPSAASLRPKPAFDREDETCKFKLYAKRGVHLLKTDCKSSGEKWIEAISRAVQNMWNNSEGQSTAPVYNGKNSSGHTFKYRLKRNFKNTWTSMFGYTALSEENEEYDKQEEDANTGGTQPIPLSTKLHKWINFPRQVHTRGNSINYGALTEDITD